jgi:co-chaperonin GroES (HSP10)
MKLEALFNAVLIKPTEETEQTYGNLYVPDLGKEKNLSGEIVSIGPGHYSVTGVWIPTTLKVGQYVILPQMGPVKVENEGVEYYICPENQVLAVLNK